MKKIIPYSNIIEANLSLDNGGKFYNILSKAEDGVISKAELGKVAGVFNDKQKMVLYLDIATSIIDKESKDVIISKLEESLQTVYHKYKSQELLPSEANENGKISSNAIITGIPRLRESKTDFNGFVMVPIMAGPVMTLSMIPIMDKYDIYELRDEEHSDTFLIAHAKNTVKLPETKLRIAGVIKEFEEDEKGDNDSNKFLEAVYYMDLV